MIKGKEFAFVLISTYFRDKYINSGDVLSFLVNDGTLNQFVYFCIRRVTVEGIECFSQGCRMIV